MNSLHSALVGGGWRCSVVPQKPLGVTGLRLGAPRDFDFNIPGCDAQEAAWIPGKRNTDARELEQTVELEKVAKLPVEQ